MRRSMPIRLVTCSPTFQIAPKQPADSATSDEQCKCPPDKATVVGMYFFRGMKGGEPLSGGALEAGGRWKWLVFTGRAAVAMSPTVPRTGTSFESISRLGYDISLTAQRRFGSGLAFGGFGGGYKVDTITSWHLTPEGGVAQTNRDDWSAQPLVRLGGGYGILQGDFTFSFVGQPEFFTSIGIAFGR